VEIFFNNLSQFPSTLIPRWAIVAINKVEQSTMEDVGERIGSGAAVRGGRGWVKRHWVRSAIVCVDTLIRHSSHAGVVQHSGLWGSFQRTRWHLCIHPDVSTRKQWISVSATQRQLSRSHCEKHIYSTKIPLDCLCVGIVPRLLSPPP